MSEPASLLTPGHWDKLYLISDRLAKDREPYLRRQQLRDRRTNLARENLTALAVEVDVVVVEFGMPTHRFI